ncbi:hypothetical protein JOE59_003158 [Agromyces cerinus]|nr:hypothetical protein [Agromyces cerinus]
MSVSVGPMTHLRAREATSGDHNERAVRRPTQPVPARRDESGQVGIAPRFRSRARGMKVAPGPLARARVPGPEGCGAPANGEEREPVPRVSGSPRCRDSPGGTLVRTVFHVKHRCRDSPPCSGGCRWRGRLQAPAPALHSFVSPETFPRVPRDPPGREECASRRIRDAATRTCPIDSACRRGRLRQAPVRRDRTRMRKPTVHPFIAAGVTAGSQGGAFHVKRCAGTAGAGPEPQRCVSPETWSTARCTTTSRCGCGLHRTRAVIVISGAAARRPGAACPNIPAASRARLHHPVTRGHPVAVSIRHRSSCSRPRLPRGSAPGLGPRVIPHTPAVPRSGSRCPRREARGPLPHTDSNSRSPAELLRTETRSSIPRPRRVPKT